MDRREDDDASEVPITKSKPRPKKTAAPQEPQHADFEAEPEPQTKDAAPIDLEDGSQKPENAKPKAKKTAASKKTAAPKKTAVPKKKTTAPKKPEMKALEDLEQSSEPADSSAPSQPEALNAGSMDEAPEASAHSEAQPPPRKRCKRADFPVNIPVFEHYVAAWLDICACVCICIHTHMRYICSTRSCRTGAAELWDWFVRARNATRRGSRWPEFLQICVHIRRCLIILI